MNGINTSSDIMSLDFEIIDTFKEQEGTYHFFPLKHFICGALA